VPKHEELGVWLQKEADMLKPGLEHGKLTETVSYYMVKKYALAALGGGGQ
jgi:hypothetical protein